MSEAEEEDIRVWPPPPAVAPSEDMGPPSKVPRMTDRSIGRVSLGLSGLGSLCALAYVLSSVADPHDHWPSLWIMVLIGSIGGFLAGFFVGIVGWYSWEGKVGLCLAVLSPLWLVVAFLVAVSQGP